ncbi:MAG: hypothetical protein J6R18_06850 [Kiritimatiellae bacterium]|nr:hypothetical protein [Kiritimatiellia bacterium]
MLYIPITFMVGGKPDSSVFQSVIAAEGIAPYLAKTFLGMGGARSGAPHLTGDHPLNPFEDRILLYSKLPRLPVGEEYAEIWHMTAFVCVEENEVQIVGANNDGSELKEGLRIRQTEGSVLFTNPKNVTFIFADETNYDYRMGLRATPCGKHDDLFRFYLLSEVEKKNVEIIDLTKEEVDRIGLLKFDGGISKKAIEESEFRERYQGAELGYELSRFSGESNPIVTFNRKQSLWNTYRNILQEMLRKGMLTAKEVESQQKTTGKAIAKNSKKSTASTEHGDKFVFSRMLKSIPANYQILLTKYCKLLCSHPYPEWNWADNTMRAIFVQKVLECCILPTLKEIGREGAIEAIQGDLMMIVRRFNEPYTFLLEDKMLKSSFAIALWRVMNSEGRHDRIKEVLTLYPGDDKAHLTLAIYGAMCGYAGFSTKRLLVTHEMGDVIAEADWIQVEVLGKPKKVPRRKIIQKKASQRNDKKPIAKKNRSLSSKEEGGEETHQEEFNLGV